MYNKGKQHQWCAYTATCAKEAKKYQDLLNSVNPSLLILLKNPRIWYAHCVRASMYVSLNLQQYHHHHHLPRRLLHHHTFPLFVWTFFIMPLCPKSDAILPYPRSQISSLCKVEPQFRGPTIFCYMWISVIANKGNRRNQLEGTMNLHLLLAEIRWWRVC